MDIEELVHTYSDTLYRIAYSYVKDGQAAEEVVQDVFLTFYEKQQFKGLAHVKTYLTRMTINRSYDYLRSWKNKRHVVVEFFQTIRPSIDEQLVVQTESEQLLQEIFKLSVKYREVIILYYYEDLQIKDIAALLNIAESTIKSRLQRARAQLKLQLQETDWEVLKNGQRI